MKCKDCSACYIKRDSNQILGYTVKKVVTICKCGFDSIVFKDGSDGCKKTKKYIKKVLDKKQETRQ